MYKIRNYQFPTFFENSNNLLETTDKLTAEEKKTILKQMETHYKEKILPQEIKQYYQKGMEDGYKQGFEKGMEVISKKKEEEDLENWRSKNYQAEFDRGFAEGKTKGEKIIQDRVAYLDHFIEKIQSDMSEILEKITDHMIGIIRCLVKKIVFCQIDRTEQLQSTLHACLKSIPGFKENDPIDIYINTEDKMTFEKILTSSGLQYSLRKVSLLEKGNIEPGGFILSWKDMIVDAELSHRLEKIMDAYDCHSQRDRHA